MGRVGAPCWWRDALYYYVAIMLIGSTRTVFLGLTVATAMAPTIQYVGGQRVLWTPCANSNGNNLGEKSEGQESKNPPVVVLGGMAQSIESWEHHIPALSQSRSVLLYEGRGQGPPVPPEHLPSSPAEDFWKDVSLPAQASYLIRTLEDLNIISQKTGTADVCVDLVGFSLGGRIAMATALLYPDRVRKLHLTGVAMDRSPLGHLTVASWKDHVDAALRLHDEPSLALRSFAWSVLLATYAPSTLQSWHQQGKLSSILDFVSKNNTPEGLAALLEQTHGGSFSIGTDSEEQREDEDEWSTQAMSRRLAKRQPLIQGHACVGSLDQYMAPVSQVEALCQVLGWKDSPLVLEGCGHAAPMEQPRLWRNHVLAFLDG